MPPQWHPPGTASLTPATGFAICMATAPRSRSSRLPVAAPSRACASLSVSCHETVSQMPLARWRVIVADDEPAARRGVKQLLQPFPDFTVVGECGDGREELSALDALQLDVPFRDILMT